MATVLVTGANRGIGLELCHHLADRGDDVIAVCRTSNSWLEQPGITVVDGIDVGDDTVVAELRKRLKNQNIDILINNAGILTRETLDDLDFDRMRLQYECHLPACIITTIPGDLVSTLSNGLPAYQLPHQTTRHIEHTQAHCLLPWQVIRYRR